MDFSSTSVLVFDIETLDLTSLTLILECSLDLHVELYKLWMLRYSLQLENQTLLE